MAERIAPGERALLRALRARAERSGHRGVRVGIGDDCAVLAPRPGEELVLTTDFSLEERHFRLDWHPPEAVGYKCLARGLSDVAAMGARPIAAFVSLALPAALTIPAETHAPFSTRAAKAARKTPSWMDRFYSGLLALADREHMTLAGGDLSSSPGLTVADIVVVGAVRSGRALLRSTARAGDILYVSGTLGGAAAELAALAQAAASRGNARDTSSVLGAESRHPHFFPQPRIALGQALVRRKLATACLDISDGLSVDLLHLCEESGLDAELTAERIPVHETANLEQALHGGDDYELLFTAGPRTPMPKTIAGVPIRAVGCMLPRAKRKTQITLVSSTRSGSKRSRLEPAGWQHF